MVERMYHTKYGTLRTSITPKPWLQSHHGRIISWSSSFCQRSLQANATCHETGGWWLFPFRWVVASMLETSSNLHDSGSIRSREEFVMTREHSMDLFSSCQKPPPYKEQNINSKLVIALPQHTVCDCRRPSFCRHTPHPDGLGNSAWGSFAEVVLPQADLQ